MLFRLFTFLRPCGLTPRRGISLGIATAVLCSTTLIRSTTTAANEISDVLAAITATDGSVAADRAASLATAELQQLPGSKITLILDGFHNATPRGANRLRALAADIADNGEFPESELRDYFANRGKHPDARYLAYQLLVGQDGAIRDRILEGAETDPSLPIRYLKIGDLIKQAASLKDAQPSDAKKTLQSVLANARNPQQLQDAAKMLADLGEDVDLADQLGMIRRWRILGPLDNTNGSGFDTSYPPEQRYIEGGAPIQTDSDGNAVPVRGKNGMIDWQLVESDDALGMVDLNEPLSNEKDAVAYAYITFRVDQDTPAQVRLGCVTANKIWVNGRLVSSNEVYHAGTRIDQYVAPCRLTTGENTILLKILQNAQTESWAQDWEFQFRLTTPDGSAIKPLGLRRDL